MKLQVQQSGSDFELFGAVLGGGFTPLSDARAVVDMHEIFDTSEGRSVQRAQKLDTKMAGDLLALPFISAPSERSLATRNMIRGQSFLLPSGEELARRCGRPEAEIAQVSAAGVAATGGILTGGMPLWYYLLTEAEVIGREDATGATEQGEGLGPLGAVIVAETIIGLLELDPRSWLGANRNWRPMDAYTGIGNMLASAQP